MTAPKGVLKRYDEATDTWIPVIGSPQAQPGLLAVKSYNPTTGVVLSTTTSFVDVDATNAAITFVVPQSGQALVRVCVDGYCNASALRYRLAEGGVEVAGTNTEVFYCASQATVRLAYEVLVTGLTPGTTKTYTLQQAGSNTAGATRYGGTGESTSNGPLVMEVWDAQTGAGVMHDGDAQVLVESGGAYAVTGGRIFIGPTDPSTLGYVMGPGDQWEQTT